MNECYKCQHRGTIPGDAHSRCKHPNLDECKVKANPNGIKEGWFVWPFNFDPVWLESCDGFKPEALK